MTRKLFSILAMIVAVAVLAMPSFGQSQTYNCGGVNCVQPRVGVEPLGASSYSGAATLFVAPNGAKLIYGYNVEDITLSTGVTTTDSTNYLLPAGAILLNVSGTVTTTITAGCTGWALGDPTTAARFAASNTTLTQGTTSIGSVNATTGIASATTGIWQAAAAKVRITCATAAPGAGKVRIAVAYLQFIPPQI